jgi:hypothetical protein
MTLRKPSNPSTGSARAPIARLAVAASALALFGALSLAGQAGAALPVGAVVGNVGATAARDLDKATRSVPVVPVPSVASATAPATKAIEQTTSAASDTLGKSVSTTTSNAVGTVSGLASTATGAGETVAGATASDAPRAHAGAAVTGVLHQASGAGAGALIHHVSHVRAVPPRNSPADGAPVTRPASVAPSRPRVDSARRSDGAPPAAMSGGSPAYLPALTNAAATTSADRVVPSRCAAWGASGFRLADGCPGRGVAASAIGPVAILPTPASALLTSSLARGQGSSVQALAPAGSRAGDRSTPPTAPSPPEPAPSPGLSASAGGTSGLALSLLLTLTAVLLLAAPPALRRLRLASESWRLAPFALIPERPG